MAQPRASRMRILSCRRAALEMSSKDARLTNPASCSAHVMFTSCSPQDRQRGSLFSNDSNMRTAMENKDPRCLFCGEQEVNMTCAEQLAGFVSRASFDDISNEIGRGSCRERG